MCVDEKDEDAAPRELNPPEHHDRPDDFFKPDYEHSEAITEYEDTPLPGALPSAAMASVTPATYRSRWQRQRDVPMRRAHGHRTSPWSTRSRGK